jgi:hypothetical protein
MIKRSDDTPAAVLQALETLEGATSPAELGRAYQALLEWRRRRPLDVFVRNAALPLSALALAGVFLIAVRLIDIVVTEYWRGFSNGILIAVIVSSLSNWFRRAAATPSIGARIETAIDRWRHAVPAMRETPR